MQLPDDRLPSGRSEPTTADLEAVRGAVRRDTTFFVLLLVGVMLAVAALAGLRWAANATSPAPTPAAPSATAIG